MSSYYKEISRMVLKWLHFFACNLNMVNCLCIYVLDFFRTFHTLTFMYFMLCNTVLYTVTMATHGTALFCGLRFGLRLINWVSNKFPVFRSLAFTVVFYVWNFLILWLITLFVSSFVSLSHHLHWVCHFFPLAQEENLMVKSSEDQQTLVIKRKRSNSTHDSVRFFCCFCVQICFCCCCCCWLLL